MLGSSSTAHFKIEAPWAKKSGGSFGGINTSSFLTSILKRQANIKNYWYGLLGRVHELLINSEKRARATNCRKILRDTHVHCFQ
jgi:hypothetical protein